jgi:hypothetical protein
MDPTAIGDQIDRILRSQSFASKSQLRKLLEILFKNMDSQTALSPDLVIKELWPDETRTKRPAHVATEMNRLRHALDSYYEGEGKNDPILISLPNRTIPGPDGMPERRWIVAKPREGENGGPQTVSEDQQPVPQTNHHRRLRRIAGIAVAGITLAIVAYVSVRALAARDQPKFGRLDGSALVVMNAEGKELWRKVFPDGFGPDWYNAHAFPALLWFGDLEGKGHASVLFVYAPAGPLSHSTTLICYSDRGQERWRWTPGRELPEFGGSLRQRS